MTTTRDAIAMLTNQRRASSPLDGLRTPWREPVATALDATARLEGIRAHGFSPALRGTLTDLATEVRAALDRCRTAAVDGQKLHIHVATGGRRGAPDSEASAETVRRLHAAVRAQAESIAASVDAACRFVAAATADAHPVDDTLDRLAERLRFAADAITSLE